VYTEILNNDGLAQLKLAFDMACNELHLRTSAKDTERRESLAKLMLSLAKAGERDPIMIRIQAVHQMRRLLAEGSFVRGMTQRPIVFVLWEHSRGLRLIFLAPHVKPVPWHC
jgi:hypothetical protein